MVRFFFISIFVLATTLLSDELDDKIKDFVSNSNYQSHKKLIDSIFQDRSSFYLNDGINTIKVIKTLKENGLLNFIFDNPKRQYIEFKADYPSLLLFKNIANILNGLGYSFFISKHIKFDKKQFIWTIEYESKNAVDPILLVEELSKIGCDIYNVDKTNDVWTYEIHTERMLLNNAILVGSNHKIFLKRSVARYYLKINTNSKKLLISSKPGNNWYPYIVFFDRKLNVIKTFKNQIVKSQISIDIPENSAYVKISDLYMAENIKKGLTALIED